MIQQTTHSNISIMINSFVRHNNTIDTFKLASVMCASILIKTKTEFSILLKKSFEILNNNTITIKDIEKTLEPSTTEHISFYPAHDRIREAVRIWTRLQPSDSEFLNRNVERFLSILPNFHGWPGVDSVFVWVWCHIIAIDLDKHYQLNERENFIQYFLENLILCGICEEHFIKNKEYLLTTLQNTSMENTMLAYHTFVNENYANQNNMNMFVYMPSLVKSTFKEFFQEMYNKITSN